MSHLLDTNVISELRQDVPDKRVWEWTTAVAEETVFISVVTIAEIRSGAARLPVGRRRHALESWIERDVRDRFRGRILGIDVDVADRCGTLLGGHHLGLHVRRVMDIWLAAIALHHGLVLVTRNERDFQDLGVKIVNPWKGHVQS